MSDFLAARNDSERYVCFPIRNAQLWKFYKQMIASFWTVEEVDLSSDKEDWDNLPQREQQWLLNVLSFFAVADGVVAENIVENFGEEITQTEARFCYGIQAFMEQIHAEMYSLLIDTYVEAEQKHACFNQCLTSECMREKVDWCKKYMDRDAGPLSQRLVAFSVVEGVMFSSSFAAIFFMRKRGKMPGLCFSNELIARDEAMHTELAVHLYLEHCEAIEDTLLREIVREGAELEKRFVDFAMETDMAGLSRKSMKEYVEYVADYLLKMYDQAPLYHTNNPLEFMELISLQGKTNFFEKRVGEYQKCNVVSGRDQSALTFHDEDF